MTKEQKRQTQHTLVLNFDLLTSLLLFWNDLLNELMKLHWSLESPSSSSERPLPWLDFLWRLMDPTEGKFAHFVWVLLFSAAVWGHGPIRCCSWFLCRIIKVLCHWVVMQNKLLVLFLPMTPPSWKIPPPKQNLPHVDRSHHQGETHWKHSAANVSRGSHTVGLSCRRWILVLLPLLLSVQVTSVASCSR